MTTAQELAEELSATHAGTCHDFDPLVGRWRVRHRRLRDRLAGCNEWAEFEGVTDFQLLLGGQANVDDNVLDAPAGRYRAATLRAWDPAAKQWSIWWLDSRYPRDLGVPMVGHFEGGDGVFYCDDRWRDQPIKVRFLWLRTRTDTPHWEQAFSPDGGNTWETNWEMDLSRMP
jgi:hypothetical protein